MRVEFFIAFLVAAWVCLGVSALWAFTDIPFVPTWAENVVAAVMACAAIAAVLEALNSL